MRYMAEVRAFLLDRPLPEHPYKGTGPSDDYHRPPGTCFSIYGGAWRPSVVSAGAQLSDSVLLSPGSNPCPEAIKTLAHRRLASVVKLG
jgi:hypothetical protein